MQQKDTFMLTPLVSILIFLIGNELAPVRGHTSFGTLTVTHKLTKKTALTIYNVLINSKDPVTQGRMYLSSPLDACSEVNALRKNDTNLLLPLKEDSVLEEIFGVLLVQDDTNCDTKLKFENTHRGGYSGVILFSDKSNIWDIDMSSASVASGLLVALMSVNEGQSLKKFARNAYVLQFAREPTSTEKWYSEAVETIQKLYAFGSELEIWLLRNYLYLTGLIWTFLSYVLQATIILSPLWFLIFVVTMGKANSEQRVPDYEDYDEEPRPWYWEYENLPPDESSSDEWDNEEESLRRHRNLLGVEVGATKQEIETVFRRKALEFHPDKNRHLAEDERKRKEDEFKNMLGAKNALLKALERRQNR